jgi:hypothetical protein
VLWEQELAINRVHRGINILTDLLVEVCEADETQVLETLYAIPDLTDKIHEGKLGELFEGARRQIIRFNADPKEPAPFDPNYMAPLTTKATFNSHAAQAMTPYAKAVLDKIAKDRGLKAPDAKTIEAVLEKTDWARAAYETKQMPPTPPPSMIRKFFMKYVFKPLDRFSGIAIPLAYIASLIVGIRVAKAFWGNWKTVAQILDATGQGGLAQKRMQQASNWGINRTRRKFDARLGVAGKWPYRK